MTTSITGGNRDRDWIVIGWFTLDYRALAEKFARNLDEVGAPYHLFYKVKPNAEWDTRQKPTVVLEAMERYPDKKLILMDVDCLVTGDLEPATFIPGDVGLSIKVWQRRRNSVAWRKPLIVTAGSRVMVFKPTAGAKAFAREWQRVLVDGDPSDADENALAWAYMLNPGISYSLLNPRYAGFEIGSPSADGSTVVWHESEHDRTRQNQRGIVKTTLRNIEKALFRRGRTKAEMRERLP